MARVVEIRYTNNSIGIEGPGKRLVERSVRV
jgi:hypothetical protein